MSCNPSKIVEARMPHYEFFCQECKKLFDKILSLVDYEEGEVLCPHCGSKKVEQRWSAFLRYHLQKERVTPLPRRHLFPATIFSSAVWSHKPRA